MKAPELSDLYRFFVEMHGNDEKGKIEYERFMAGELAPDVLAYCRKRVSRNYALLSVPAEAPRSIFLPTFFTARFTWARGFAAMHAIGRFIAGSVPSTLKFNRFSCEAASLESITREAP